MKGATRMEKQAENEEYKDSPTIIRQYCCSSVEALLPKLIEKFKATEILEDMLKIADCIREIAEFQLKAMDVATRIDRSYIVSNMQSFNQE